MTRVVATLQGAYYVATGLWPLFSMGTFEAVSGPKTDDWLVHTVGVLVSVIGVVLLSAAVTGQLGAPLRLLAIGTAASLASLEFIYSLQGVIWPIYMLDAVGELVLIVLWAVALVRDRGKVVLPEIRRPPVPLTKSSSGSPG
jgi:hypothetical protein